MARTNPAILASVVAGLLLAGGLSALAAQSGESNGYSWAIAKPNTNSTDTTSQVDQSVTDGRVVLVLRENVATAQLRVGKRCVATGTKESITLDGVMSAWLEGAILKPESYSKEREALPGHAAVKQKQLKAKQSTPEVRSKKRTAAPDQPWETEFLVRNAGRSPNCPDHLFVGEPS